MNFLKEFREFAIRGNAVDMAVGIVIGAAFGKIVTSLVNDIVMPPIGMLLGGVDFSDLAILLKQGNEMMPPVTINYGIFLNTVLDFTIIAFSIFMVIKGMNTLARMKKKAPTTKSCPECLMEIPAKATRCGHCTATIK